jgi:hypothetical protein
MPEDVAYLTCPDCMMPNHVGDTAAKYMCFSCYSEIIFETCADCGFEQSIPSRWQRAFTCGRCETRCEIPRTRVYSTATKAARVGGYGYVYPKF